jgi:hypothetical protein
VGDLELTMPTAVPDPAALATTATVEIWKEHRKEFGVKTKAYRDFKAGLYSLVLGQCTPALEDQLRSSTDFAAAKQDGIALLVLIRTLSNHFEVHRYAPDAACQIMEEFYAFAISPRDSLSRYHDKFSSKAKAIEQVGLSIVDRAVLIGHAVDADNPTDAERDAAHQRALAIRFLRGAKSRYSGYLEELSNAQLEGRTHYPATLSEAYKILLRRPVEVARRQVDEGGVAFATAGEEATPGDDGRVFPRTECHHCHVRGHYADHCPSRDGPREGTQGAPAGGFVFAQHQSRGLNIPVSSVLIDNGSNVDVFCNASLLSDIRTVGRRMYIRCNAGVRWTDQQGHLSGYGLVWYCPSAIANILSLSNISRRYRVTFDSRGGNQFLVTRDDGSVRAFGMSDSGLYYSDYSAKDVHATVLVTTVDNNKSKYTKAEVSRAEVARKLQTSIGRPSTRDFVRIVNSNLLPNCPVSKRDIMAAEDIFGPDIGSVKGKTTRRTPRRVSTEDAFTVLPKSVHDRYRDVTICADLMHVNGITFFVTFSRHIRFGSIEVIPNKNQATLFKAMKQIAAVYHNGGFRIRHAFMDGAFECLRDDLHEMQIMLNTTARDEHVGDIERFIRTVKERMRATFSMLPFDHVPDRMVMELAKREVFWLNSFPLADGVSTTLGPRTIVTGATLSYERHCRFDFGDYVQTHEEHDNTMASRTIGAIALRPTGNIQGSFRFFSLLTGRVLTRNAATKLPMPAEVANRMQLLARRQKANRGLIFLDQNRERYEEAAADEDDDEANDSDDDCDDDYDDDYDPDSDDESYDPESGGDDDDSDDDHYGDNDDNVAEQNGGGDLGPPDVMQPDGDNDDDVGEPDLQQPDGDIDDDVAEQDEAVDEAGVVSEEPDSEPHDPASSDSESESEMDPVSSVSELESEPDVEVENVENGDEEDGVEDDVPALMDASYGNRTGAHNLRPRRRPSFSHLHTNVGVVSEGVQAAPGVSPVGTDSVVNEGVQANEGVSPDGTDSKDVEEAPLGTPQMSMKRGLKIFGEDGQKAVSKEMQQLHDREVMEAKHSRDLTPKERQDALAYLMFLKRKRCGKVKGRGCADGRKQREWTEKSESSSPTISNNAVFLTAVVDALEGRDVAIADVPGAFMQVDMDEIVHVRFTGIMVEKLLEIDPEMYSPYVVYEGKQKVMYVELLKALYGTLRASRLFWEKLSGKMQEWGFVPNPYDSCVVNKTINGKQCTVGWHVDDLKISHVEPEVVTGILDLLNEEFGKEEPLTFSRGKIHEYLGMRFDFSVAGEVAIDQIDYIKSVIADMPEEMKGTSATPAASHLFSVKENPVPLPRDQADIFHRMVMQLLYLSQRGRPDLQLAISYLCKRTSYPDEDDYKKLTRVMRYVQGTIELVLTLSADGSGAIRWWVDASYGVHADMKGHTGGTMSMGKGSIFSTAKAQKLVACSSTESELIGVHDVMPQLIWTSYFMKAQGHEVTDKVVLYQDNKSTILLANNGRSSSGKRTRHINIRYFFVKDRVKNGELRIEHCPTEDMWADYFTKPLQGLLFYKLRDWIMNVSPNSKYHSGTRSVLDPKVADPKVADPKVGADVIWRVPSTYRSYKAALLANHPPARVSWSEPVVSMS